MLGSLCPCVFEFLRVLLVLWLTVEVNGVMQVFSSKIAVKEIFLTLSVQSYAPIFLSLQCKARKLCIFSKVHAMMQENYWFGHKWQNFNKNMW